MPIDEYLKSLKEPLWRSTLCFLLSSDQILLGKKKRGIGKGNYLGIGGKVERGEEVIDATIREVQEEICVTPYHLKRVAILTFLFPDKPQWNQEVHTFVTYDWEGLPRETEEIDPKWFDKDKIPFNQMWDDGKYWVPQILEGNKLIGAFQYTKGLKVSHKKITEF